jgi:hypothetical protein
MTLATTNSAAVHPMLAPLPWERGWGEGVAARGARHIGCLREEQGALPCAPTASGVRAPVAWARGWREGSA